MKKLLRVVSVIAAIVVVGAAPAFAMSRPPGGGGGGGGGAPSPEIGAGILGTILAGGLALYIRRRNRD
jgi:hypothetical protein